MPDKITTIQVTVEIRDRLVKRGGKKDTYDSIIRRLLDGVKEFPKSSK